MRIPACCLILALPASALAQQEEPIITERPSFSSSPFTLAPATLQIEAGYQYLTDDSGVDIDVQNLPLLLVRYGLADRVELQVGWGGYAWADVGNRSRDGITDASVGVKWQVTDSTALVPVSLFAGLSVPIGDDEFSNDEADPTVAAFWSYSAALDWFGTVVISEPDDDTVISNALGVSLPIDDRLGSYVEYYGTFGSGGPQHTLNGGVTYLARYNLQWDAYLAAGLNDRTPDFAFGVGMAYRF